MPEGGHRGLKWACFQMLMDCVPFLAWFYFEAGSVCQRGTLRLNMGMLSMLMDCVPWLAFCKLGVLKARTV